MLLIRDKIDAVGEFWAEGGQDKRPGRLTISKHGKIYLELHGQITPGDHPFSVEPENPRINILGHTYETGPVKLKDCFWVQRSYGGPKVSAGTVKYFAHRAYLGSTASDTQTKRILVDIHGLADWLAIRHINAERVGNDSLRVSVTQGQPIDFYRCADFVIRLVPLHSVDGIGSVSETTLKHWWEICIETAEFVPDEDLLGIAFEFQQFLSFARGEVANFQRIKASLREVEDRFVSAEIIHQAVISTDEAIIVQGVESTLPFNAISDFSGDVFGKWRLLLKNSYAAIRLLSGHIAEVGGSKHDKFLSIARSAENFHRSHSDATMFHPEEFERIKSMALSELSGNERRWMESKLQYANEISLSKRLKDLCKQFDFVFTGSADSKKFVRDVVTTRNFLTHFDPSLKQSAIDGAGLIVLTDRLRSLIELAVLSQLLGDRVNLQALFRENWAFRRRREFWASIG